MDNFRRIREDIQHILALQEDELRKILAIPISLQLERHLKQILTAKQTPEHISYNARSKSSDDFNVLYSSMTKQTSDPLNPLSCPCSTCTSLVKSFKEPSKDCISADSKSLKKSSSCINLEFVTSHISATNVTASCSSVSNMSSCSSLHIKPLFTKQPGSGEENYVDDSKMAGAQSNSEIRVSKVSRSSSLKMNCLFTTPLDLGDFKDYTVSDENISVAQSKSATRTTSLESCHSGELKVSNNSSLEVTSFLESGNEITYKISDDDMMSEGSKSATSIAVESNVAKVLNNASLKTNYIFTNPSELEDVKSYRVSDDDMMPDVQSGSKSATNIFSSMISCDVSRVSSSSPLDINYLFRNESEIEGVKDSTVSGDEHDCIQNEQSPAPSGNTISKKMSNSSLNIKYLFTNEHDDEEKDGLHDEFTSSDNVSNSLSTDDKNAKNIHIPPGISLTIDITEKDLRSYSSISNFNDAMNWNFESLDPEKEEIAGHKAASPYGDQPFDNCTQHGAKIHSNIPGKDYLQKVEEVTEDSKGNRDGSVHVMHRMSNKGKMMEKPLFSTPLKETEKLKPSGEGSNGVNEEGFHTEHEVQVPSIGQRFRKLLQRAGKSIRNGFKKTFCCCIHPEREP